MPPWAGFRAGIFPLLRSRVHQDAALGVPKGPPCPRPGWLQPPWPRRPRSDGRRASGHSGEPDGLWQVSGCALPAGCRDSCKPTGSHGGSFEPKLNRHRGHGSEAHHGLERGVVSGDVRLRSSERCPKRALLPFRPANRPGGCSPSSSG